MKLSNVIAAAFAGAVFQLLVFFIILVTVAVGHGSPIALVGGLVFASAAFTGVGVLVSMEEDDAKSK